MVRKLYNLIPLLTLVLLALGLRLLVWRWHRLYDLGGDEREYFEQALTLLREHRYVELNLMRPPLYTGFLAACIYLLGDSLVQQLRLVQAIIGALTVLPIYALTLQLFGSRRVALIAGLLLAANYTLAANATELLTETLFVFGLTTLFWLLLAGDRRSTTDDRRPTTEETRDRRHETGDTRPETRDRRHEATDNRQLTTDNRRRPLLYAGIAGLCLGALVLLRSVALPLLPLGALWLLLRRPTTDDRPRTRDKRQETRDKRFRPFVLCSLFSVLGRFSVLGSRFSAPLFFVLCSLLVILPWTARNYATYGAPILVDTTGAENLWLDNDPAGREEVKRQLYDLGDDRAQRQRIALARGAAVIAADPGRFLAKAWGEAQRFFALEYFDDMRARQAIWIPPLEVWLRLLLGDGLWLVILFGGIAGFWLAPTTDDGRLTTDNRQPAKQDSGRWSVVGGRWSPHWLFVPWALYTLLTALIFHVELRYRLPLYPALLPYAAWALLRIADWVKHKASNRSHLAKSGLALLSCLLVLGLLLLHRPYISESWMLGWKHLRLGQAERALDRGDAAGARGAAQAALGWDAESSLAQVMLAQTALLEGDSQGALLALDAAITALPAQPQAHLLRGAILRAQGDAQAARAELALEDTSREDLQSWAWRAFALVAPAPSAVEVGGGLDLGSVRGFWLPEDDGFRWSSAQSEMLLTAPDGATRIELRLAAGRPDGAPPAEVAVLASGRVIGTIQLEPGWQTYSLPLSVPPGPLVLTLRSHTFRPRDYDRASPDDRDLGVMVSWVSIK